jgi:hypothetical protein
MLASTSTMPVLENMPTIQRMIPVARRTILGMELVMNTRYKFLQADISSGGNVARPRIFNVILQDARDARDLWPVAPFLQFVQHPMESGLVMHGRGHGVAVGLHLAG